MKLYIAFSVLLATSLLIVVSTASVANCNNPLLDPVFLTWAPTEGVLTEPIIANNLQFCKTLEG